MRHCFAQNLHVLVERRRVEAQRASVILALIARLLARHAGTEPFQAAQADALRRFVLKLCLRLGAAVEAATIQIPANRLDAFARPAPFRHPTSWAMVVVRLRPDRILHPGSKHGLLVDAGFLALEPLIPPPETILQEADLRARACVMGKVMAPGTDEGAARRLGRRHHPGNGARQIVRPAADGIDGGLCLAELVSRRSFEPIGITPLMVEPIGQHRFVGGQPRLPLDLPVRARGLRIGRQAVEYKHRGGPPHGVDQDRTAGIVERRGVAVFRGADGNDGLEASRRARSRLQPADAAPRLPEHADCARAPGLAPEPFDDSEAVFLLALVPHVGEQSVGIAGATRVDAQAGIAVPGEVRVDRLIAQPQEIALAIRHVFEDRRNGIALRIRRQPQACRQAHAVRHGNPNILDLTNLARETRDDAPSGLLRHD